MGNNFHTPWTTASSFRASEMVFPLSQLDKIITYLKRAIVSCAGNITWSGGTLTWSGTISIYFIREDGQTILNTIAAGSQAVSDGQFVYVALNETNNTVLTTSVASASGGSASNFLTNNILVLGYRNTTSDAFYPVNLTVPLTAANNPFDIGLFYPGIPDPNITLLNVSLTRTVTFPADFSGSYAISVTAASAEFMFEIEKNSVQVATITFAAASDEGVFDSSGIPVVFIAGDILTVVSETVSAADATLSDVGITLAGLRS